MSIPLGGCLRILIDLLACPVVEVIRPIGQGGEVADTPLRAPMVCAFHVFSAHSARFHLRWPFGTSSYYNSFSFMGCLNSVEHSLSSTCF